MLQKPIEKPGRFLKPALSGPLILSLLLGDPIPAWALSDEPATLRRIQDTEGQNLLRSGMEEMTFPEPEDPDTPPAQLVWKDGGDVVPFGGERLPRMTIMGTRGGPPQYQRFFASIRVSQLPPALQDLVRQLPGDGSLDSGDLYFKGVRPGEGVSPVLRGRIKQELAPYIPKRVQIQLSIFSGDGGRIVVKEKTIGMKVRNVWPDGWVRFEGRLEAKPEYVGDHSFTVELFWNNQWYRLDPAGRIRIRPPNPSQVLSEPTGRLRDIGVEDGEQELALAQQNARQAFLQAKERAEAAARVGDAEELARAQRGLDEAAGQLTLANQGVVTGKVISRDQRAPRLNELVSRGKISPAEAVQAFVAQQQAVDVQKRDFFTGTEYRVGVLPDGPVDIMFNPNRANTPKPPAPEPGQQAPHPLDDAHPIRFVVGDRIETLRQRTLPGFAKDLDNPVDYRLSPYGYTWRHFTMPVAQQVDQARWAEPIRAAVREMWLQRGIGTVVGGNIALKAAASLPEWAHLHGIPWRMPMDNPGDDEIEWFFLLRGIRVGILKNPGMTTFVLEGQGTRAEQDAMIARASQILDWLKEPGVALTEYNVWGVVGEDGLGRLFITPRNLAEPVPPAGDQRWRPSDDYAKPLADRDYWVAELSPGQFRLMGWEEMERFGLVNQTDPAREHRARYDRSRPLVRQGRPVLDVKMGLMEIRRILLISRREIFEDRFLEARLIKAYERIGLPWDHPGIAQVLARLRAQPGDRPLNADADEEVRSALRTLNEIREPRQLGQLIELFERIGRWSHRTVEAFGRLGESRDQLTQQAFRLVRMYAERFPHLVRLEKEIPPPPERAAEREERLPTLVGLSLNGTLDLVVSVKTRADGTKQLAVRLHPGGFAPNLVQATHALGAPAELVAVVGGETGEAIVETLRGKGVTIEPILRKDGQSSRVSLMVASDSGAERRLVGVGTPLPPEAIREAAQEVRRVMEEEAARAEKEGRPVPHLALGERLVDEPSNHAQVEEARWAKGRGFPTIVEANASWDSSTRTRFQEVGPDLFITAQETLANFLGTSGRALRYRPEEAAAQAETLRRTHGIREWLIPVRAGGLVLVNDRARVQVLPSPVLRLTYTSGATHAAIAAFRLGNLLGYPPAEAARLGTTADTLSRERREEERGRDPSRKELLGNLFRTQVNVLPVPVAAGMEEEESRRAPGPILLFPGAVGVSRSLTDRGIPVAQMLWEDQGDRFDALGLGVPTVRLGARPSAVAEEQWMLGEVVPAAAGELGTATVGRTRFDFSVGGGLNEIIFAPESLGQLLMALAGMEEASLPAVFEEIAADTDTLGGNL